MKDPQVHSRRDFIRKTGTGVAGAIITTKLGAFPNTLSGKHKKVGIALVGLGYYSTDVLAPALQHTDTAYLAGIVTGTPWKEGVWAEKYDIPGENIYNYENFDSIAENREIDIVYVVLPNSMHKEFTIRAAKAGKHVICEKPMAVTAGECREMIDACEENGVLLSVGYRLHYDPYNIEAMRLGQQKILGSVQHIDCGAAYYHTNLDSWKLKRAMGGGSMFDMGVYPLQAARYVTGEEPVRVSAQKILKRDAFREVDEGALFQLEFPGGAVASLSTGFHARSNFLHVSAEDGRFSLQPFSGYRNNRGTIGREPMSFPEVNQQAAQMDDVARAVLNGGSVRVTGEEGFRDLVVVEAVYRAIDKKCSIEIT